MAERSHDSPVIRYRSWAEFSSSFRRDLFDDDVFVRGRFLFRGVRAARWRLESSFDRRFPLLPPGEREAVSKRLLRDFLKECEAHALPAVVFEDETTALALGQHFGLPTRLLDWSESPYVAAFFAFDGSLTHVGPEERRDDVAIWVLDRRLARSPDCPGIEVVQLASVGNVRLRSQGGSFTRLTTEDIGLEQVAERLETTAGPLLRLIVLPPDEARAALADLDVMGVNHARLFPDLGGAAASALTRTMIDAPQI